MAHSKFQQHFPISFGTPEVLKYRYYKRDSFI